MAVIKYDQLDLSEVIMGGAEGVSKTIALDSEDGWDGYTMRVFRLAPGGYTPKHEHDWEHVNYVIAGSGKLTIGEEVHDLETRDFAVVPANVRHHFENPTAEDFEFICIVPDRGEA